VGSGTQYGRVSRDAYQVRREDDARIGQTGPGRALGSATGPVGRGFCRTGRGTVGLQTQGRGRAERSARGPRGRGNPPHTGGGVVESSGASRSQDAGGLIESARCGRETAPARFVRGRAESKAPARGPLSSSRSGPSPLALQRSARVGPERAWPSGRPAHASCVRARAAAAASARARVVGSARPRIPLGGIGFWPTKT
jgi:hypothetical protein